MCVCVAGVTSCALVPGRRPGSLSVSPSPSARALDAQVSFFDNSCCVVYNRRAAGDKMRSLRRKLAIVASCLVGVSAQAVNFAATTAVHDTSGDHHPPPRVFDAIKVCVCVCCQKHDKMFFFLFCVYV